LEFAKDKSPLIRHRFVNRVIDPLNEYYGVSNTPFVIELIGILDRLKSDSDREVSESAFEVDEKVKFYKFPNKEKQKEFDIREQELKKIEAALVAREQFELEEEERKKKEQEEEKFDIAALLEKMKKTKGRGIGFSIRPSFTTISKMETSKKSI
jgi:hypothetical protein